MINHQNLYRGLSNWSSTNPLAKEKLEVFSVWCKLGIDITHYGGTNT